MTFREYLQAKKIDPKAFALGEPGQFKDFKALFDQLHPDSFTAQKLFLINKIRRRFPYTEPAEAETKEAPKAKMMKPKLNIIPKTKE